MAYSPVKAETFGGLNLRGDAGEAGWSGALDCLNTELLPGRVRSRRGYSKYAGSAASSIDSLHWVKTSGTDRILVGTTDPAAALQVFDSGFVSAQTVTRIDTTTGTSQSSSAITYNFVSFGDTTNEYVYIANGTDQIRRLKPSTLTFTAPAGLSTYKGPCLAVTPWDNRLVINGDTNLSRVWFSDAGTPETIGANNYVDLEPGDGERIMAIRAWRDLLFVFKETKFFVFYGTDTDSSGNPIFRYRTVRAGVGVDSTTTAFSQRATVAGPDALYFVSKSGVYRTTGGPPECISDDIQPLFLGAVAVVAPFFTAASDFGLAADTATAISLTWADGRLYFNAGQPLFVWEPGLGWMLWSVPGASAIQAIALAPTSGIMIAEPISGTGLWRYARDLTNSSDNGTAIVSRYRSGFSDLGSPDLKTIREWRLQGTGSPTLKVSQDFGSLETGAAVTLGTSPAVVESRRRYAMRGRQFSWQVGASSGLWTLNSIVANVREKRAPGVHASA